MRPRLVIGFVPAPATVTEPSSVIPIAVTSGTCPPDRPDEASVAHNSATIATASGQCTVTWRASTSLRTTCLSSDAGTPTRRCVDASAVACDDDEPAENAGREI